MAHRAPLPPPSPRLSGVPRRLLRPPPPLLLLLPFSSLSSFSARLVLSCQQEGAARSHKAGGCSIFSPPHPHLHWGATVSLEASRLLPSRLVGFPLPPPTFNHLFTAVTQRKASPGGNTPIQLGLFGVWCRSAGEGERWPVWQEEMQRLQLRCFFKPEFLS